MSETGTLSEPRSTIHQLGFLDWVCVQLPFLNSVSELPSTALSDTPDTPNWVLLNVEDWRVAFPRAKLTVSRQKIN